MKIIIELEDLSEIEKLKPLIDFIAEMEKPKPQEINLGTKLSDIPFSARTANCLRHMELETVADILLLGRSKLLLQQNFGRKSLNEIKDLIGYLGHNL